MTPKQKLIKAIETEIEAKNLELKKANYLLVRIGFSNEINIYNECIKLIKEILPDGEETKITKKRVVKNGTK